MEKKLENDISFIIEGGWEKRWRWYRWRLLPYPKRVTEPKPITTGTKGFLIVPFNCKVIEGTLILDQAGLLGVDIRITDRQLKVSQLLALESLEMLRKSCPFNQDIIAGDALQFFVYLALDVYRCHVSLKVRRPYESTG